MGNAPAKALKGAFGAKDWKNDAAFKSSTYEAPVHVTHERDFLDLYTLQRVLGDGTSAVVRAGVRLDTKEEVAVKLIQKHGLNQDATRKVEREIKAWRQLAHPNICRLYEVHETPNAYAFVCESVECGDLLERINEHGSFSEDEVRPYFRELVSAVEYCHNRGIVHRDLKLENILLDSDNTIKLADFGFAGFFDMTGEKPMTEFCGSPPYAAPEIFMGRPYIGPEIDVWSLGVVLYALCVGSLPFTASNLDDLTCLVVTGCFDKPFFLSAELSRLLSGILRVSVIRRATLANVQASQWLAETAVSPLGDAVQAGDCNVTPGTDGAAPAAGPAEPSPAAGAGPRRALFETSGKATSAVQLVDGTISPRPTSPAVLENVLLFSCAKCNAPDSAHWDFERRGPGDCVKCTHGARS